jgi:hypothetical protein
LQEGERQVHMVRENLQIAHSRQKSYADHRQRELSVDVQDDVYLRVLPMRRLLHFKIQAKLAPRFIGPLTITKEREEEFKAEFVSFSSDPSESRGRDLF